MFKKTMSAVLIISMICSCSSIVLGDNSPLNLTVSAKEKGAADYSYAITPLMTPFNEYFYIKTDNPDPLSFRFVDNSTVYGKDSACGSLNLLYDSWNEEMTIFSDVVYEDKSTSRVKGGYIFEGNNTDGGYVTLQYKKEISYSEYSKLEKEGNSNIGEITETISSSSNGGAGFKTYRIIGYYKWENTSIKIKLPKLVNEVDYLVDTYAKKNSFFDNMDAVQSGLSSICLYSGSYIRGELYKSGSYWSLSTSPHRDQTFYLQSPYSRKDNKSLFASAIYPFRYDSLGFPSMMARVSERLDSSSTYTWDEFSHADINVTYNGETHMYGGQGNGEGQGISEDKIKKFFSFGSDEPTITLQSAKKLLDDYSEIKMNDDVPRNNALTWEKVCVTVGDGSWVRLTDVYSVFGGSQSGYTYFYKENDGKNHWADSAGSNGAEIYWGGDLGFLSDAWVDGRYIDAWESFVPGAKFEDHPTSDIMFTSITIPQISYDYTYRYNSTIYEYEKIYSNIKINEKGKKNILFKYDDNVWKVGYEAFDDGCANYNDIAEMVEKGLIDKKYLDMITLTLDEVKALKVDKNTDTIPLKGYIYDGTAEPGTPFEIVSLTDSNVSVTLSSSIFTYNGNVQIPIITVKYKGKTLKKNTDYTLTYSNQSSKSTGRYTVKVEGVGNYTGTVQKSYLIIPPANSIRLDNSTLNLTVGESRLLKATTDPSGASSGVTWTSSDTKVATVSNGSVKAVGKGKATITAKTSNGKTATCTVTVSVAVTGISLSRSTLRLNKGDSSTLTATITPSDAGNKTVTWSSSNNAVVSVSGGKITAKSAGTATITATTNNGKTASCIVMVVVPETEVTISKTTVIIAAGKSVTLTAKVLPNDATNKTVTWQSSNQNVATVSAGKIVAKKEGTAVITVSTSNGKTATCKVIVKKNNTRVVSGDVNGDGTTDISDALMVSRYDAGLITLTPEQIIEADINEDGNADIADALMIARYDAGLIEYLL